MMRVELDWRWDCLVLMISEEVFSDIYPSFELNIYEYFTVIVKVQSQHRNLLN